MSKQTLTIRLHKSELIYDIRNKAYLTGRSLGGGERKPLEQIASMQASEDDEDMNQILRSIGSATEMLRSALGEYATDSSEASPTNALIDEEGELRLTLSMPSNYNASVSGSIASSAHEYIVCQALSEWFLITNKEDAASYATLATGHLAAIRLAIHKRKRPQRAEV